MKGQTNIILALIFALIVAVFAVINVDPVEVNYLFDTGEAPLILIILGSSLMGGIITAAFGLIKIYRLQREVKQLKKSNANLENKDEGTLEQPSEEETMEDTPNLETDTKEDK